MLRAVHVPTIPRRGNARLTGHHFYTRGWFRLRPPLSLSYKEHCHCPHARAKTSSQSKALGTQQCAQTLAQLGAGSPRETFRLSPLWGDERFQLGLC